MTPSAASLETRTVGTLKVIHVLRGLGYYQCLDLNLLATKLETLQESIWSWFRAHPDDATVLPAAPADKWEEFRAAPMLNARENARLSLPSGKSAFFLIRGSA